MKISKNTIALFLSALALVVLIMLANKGIVGPTIQTDEGGYLANAAALAGYANDAYSSYKAGYSLMISPAFLLGDTPQQIWFFVKLINAILLALTFLTTCMLLGEVTGGTGNFLKNIFISLIVTCYPMYVTISGYSFSENLFVPIFVLSSLFLVRAMKYDGNNWLLLGFSVAFLYWIHEKGIIVCIALGLSLLILSIRTRKVSGIAQTLVAFILMLIAYKFLLDPFLFEQMNISGIKPRMHYPSTTKLLSVLLTLDGWWKFTIRLSGHLFYITIGTLGIVWLGFIILVTSLNNNHEKSGIHTLGFMHDSPLIIFLLLSFLGTIFISCFMFSRGDGPRLDHFMYGRYVEGVIAPVLAIGLASNSFYILRSFSFNFLLLLMAFIFSVSVTQYQHTASFNVASFWQEFVARDGGIAVWYFTGVLFIILLSFLKKNVARVYIILFFLICSYFQILWHNDASVNAKNRTEKIVLAIAKDKRIKKLYFDKDILNEYYGIMLFNDLNFPLYNYSPERINFAEWFSLSENTPFVTFDKNHLNNDGVFLMQDGWKNSLVLMKGSKSFDYPIAVGSNNGAFLYMLKDGWHELEPKLVWSKDSSSLRLVTPKTCNKDMKYELSFNVFNASNKNKKEVKITDKDNSILFERVFTDSQLVHIDFPVACNRSDTIINFSINKTESPLSLGMSKDVRELGIALRKIDIIEAP